MRALARKASKLAVYGAAGLCAQKSGASDKILKLCRNSSLAAKIGAGGLVCAAPLALKFGAGVALKFTARKILTLGVCELSKFAALKCAKLGARAVVRSFSRTDKFTGARAKKYASADGESSKASVTPRRKRTASVSSVSAKKNLSLSKSTSAKRDVAAKSAPAKKSAPIAKTASTAKSIAIGAASVSVAKSTFAAKSPSIKSTAQNKISAPSVKAIPAKSASQNVKSRCIAKNTAVPAVVIVAKNDAVTTATSASTAKQSRRAAMSAPLKSSAAEKS